MVSADIELPELLGHFIAEACSLVEARYGALGVLNPARTALDQFLTVGLTDEEERRSAHGQPDGACSAFSSPTPSRSASTICTPTPTATDFPPITRR